MQPTRQARTQYSRLQFATALRHYQSILRLQPHSRPDPRIGIGLCYERMGMHTQARYAFERAIELVS